MTDRNAIFVVSWTCNVLLLLLMLLRVAADGTATAQRLLPQLSLNKETTEAERKNKKQSDGQVSCLVLVQSDDLTTFYLT